MRKLIAGMKVSADGKVEGPDGAADWVEAWSEDYGLMPQIEQGPNLLAPFRSISVS
jgi:hypothetical protein